MNRNTFVFYESFLKQLECLPDDEQLIAYRMITYYSLYGEEQEEFDSPMLKMMWLGVKPSIDRQRANYEHGKKGAKYGKRGGRPAKKDNEKPSQKPPPVSNKKPQGVSANNPPPLRDENPYKDKDKKKDTDTDNTPTSDELKFKPLKGFVKFRDRVMKNEAWVNGIILEFENKNLKRSNLRNLIDQFGLVQLTRMHTGWENQKDFASHFKNWIKKKYPAGERIDKTEVVVVDDDFREMKYR